MWIVSIVLSETVGISVRYLEEGDLDGRVTTTVKQGPDDGVAVGRDLAAMGVNQIALRIGLR